MVGYSPDYSDASVASYPGSIDFFLLSSLFIDLLASLTIRIPILLREVGPLTNLRDRGLFLCLTACRSFSTSLSCRA